MCNSISKILIVTSIALLSFGFYTKFQDGNTAINNGERVQISNTGYIGLSTGDSGDTGGQNKCIESTNRITYGETVFNGYEYSRGDTGGGNERVGTQSIQRTGLVENDWRITSYYTPVRGQLSYYKGSYQADYDINCMGNCLSTANGFKLKQEHKYKIVACPKEFELGTRFKLTLPNNQKYWPNKTWIVTCQDRGGSIKGKRIDLWSGSGIKGEQKPWVGEMDSRNVKVEILN